MATTLINPAAGFATYALQARTDAAGDPVDDVTGEDLRLLASLFGAGAVGDGFIVSERGAGANMSVDVGSGSAASDVAVVAGTASGQGNYVVRLGDAVTNVSVNASNISNPRIDEIYLVVQDNQYDASGRVIARLAYRDGTPAASPVAPGPDGAWDAYLLLASVLVGAGVTSIVDANITDERPSAAPLGHAATHHSTGVDPMMVMGSATSGGYAAGGAGTGTVGTGFGDRASVTFTRPAGWRSFDIMAWGIADHVQSGNSTGAVITRMVIGVAGLDHWTSQGFSSLTPAERAIPNPMSANQLRTDITASTIDIRIQSRKDDSALSVSCGSASVHYLAIRRT
jgi:hypothetical protein